MKAYKVVPRRPKAGAQSQKTMCWHLGAQRVALNVGFQRANAHAPRQWRSVLDSRELAPRRQDNGAQRHDKYQPSSSMTLSTPYPFSIDP